MSGKDGDDWWQLAFYAIGFGAIIYGIWKWQHRYDNGWDIEGSATWCHLRQPGKSLTCEYFSQEHCLVEIQKQSARQGLTYQPICVANPRK